MPDLLEFEEPIGVLLKEIEALSLMPRTPERERSIETLRKRADDLRAELYAILTPWQRVLVARHPSRPNTLDYVERLFTGWDELRGDRRFADDHAIICGFAQYRGQHVAVVGHQKGGDTKQKIYRNFGYARPEGYRKALRVMQLAEKFRRPIFTFVDTPGAYPGIDAEERGQSEAIGHNLYAMSELKVPIIATVIGEGGSGGALAIAMGDQVLMLQYSTYSVISPEGCATILWKNSDKASDAAEIMGITAHRLKALGLIDKIVAEPVGGAHRDPTLMAQMLKRALADALRQFQGMKTSDLLAQRYERLAAYGKFKEIAPQE